MLNAIGNNFRQRETDNADNVMLNACGNCKHRQLLLCSASACVTARCVCFVNHLKRVVINGFSSMNIVFCKSVDSCMTGIAKILFSTSRTLLATRTSKESTHHFLLTLLVIVKNVLLWFSTVLIILWSAVQVRDALPIFCVLRCAPVRL